jgi:tellurite resistance protein
VVVRVFFHLTSDSEVILDEQGIEVDCLDHARREALKAIIEVRAEDPMARDWSGWAFSVTDADGRIVLSLDLDGNPA